MELVKQDDPILRKECEPFDFMNPAFDPIDYARHIIKFLYDNNGVGISASQVGIPYRVIAMRAHPENFVCFNPKVVQPSEQEVILEEVSLTYPGLIIKVKRPQHVRVRFTVPNGDVRTETFTGISARIFQHQLDYLDGKVYFHRANRYNREIAFKRWQNSK